MGRRSLERTRRRESGDLGGDHGSAKRNEPAMKLVAFTLFGCLLSAQTKIVGTFHYPDAVTVTGKATISLPRVGVTNKCASPVQVVRFPPVTIKIAAGALASLALYA